jgi:amino-acid N-acetyltransferase
MSQDAQAAIHIRAATPDDVAGVEAVLAPFVAEKKLLPRTREELLKLIQNGFVAEQAGRIVGFCAIEIYSRKLAEIQGLAVSSSVQRQGIGRRLIEACVERAREQSIYELLAITASEDLFRSCGFDYALPDQKRALFFHPSDTS